MIEGIIDLVDRLVDERPSARRPWSLHLSPAKYFLSRVIPRRRWTVNCLIIGLGREDERVANRGQVADLIVLGLVVRLHEPFTLLTLHAANFETRRPVLMFAERAPAVSGKNVVIAWNGTPESVNGMS